MEGTAAWKKISFLQVAAIVAISQVAQLSCSWDILKSISMVRFVG